MWRIKKGFKRSPTALHDNAAGMRLKFRYSQIKWNRHSGTIILLFLYVQQQVSSEL